MAEFTSERVYLHVLLGEYSKYIIPDYQRPYKWDCLGKNDQNSQINTMWDDLLSFYKDTDNSRPYYFMGSMVLSPYENSTEEFEVIDGQQRLTSILILYSAIKCVLTLERKSLKEDSLKTSIDKSIDLLDRRLFNNNSHSLNEKKVKIESTTGFNFDNVLLSVMNCDDNVSDFINQVEGNEQYITTINRYFKNKK